MIEEFLPVHDFNEVHRISCSAPPEVVMSSARELTPRELPLLVMLMAIRSLPALARGRRPPMRGTIVDAFRRGGFVILEDTPDELVLGAIGRFWRASGGLEHVEPDRFRGFSDPGWAKVAFAFRVEQIDARTVLETETRVVATNHAARLKFGRYWRLIRPASGAIRIAWLRAIRRHAERAHAQRLAGAAGSG